MNNDHDLNGNRLLIVDDQRLFGELIGAVGASVGFSVAVTVTVDEFMEQLDVVRPSVVTVDLLMPDVDGIELLRELATRGCHAKILVISGFDDRMLSTAEVLGRELGLQIAGVIAKPIRAAELRSMLEILKE